MMSIIEEKIIDALKKIRPIDYPGGEISVRDLMRKTELHECTVINNLKILVEKGMVERIEYQHDNMKKKNKGCRGVPKTVFYKLWDGT